MSAGGTSSASGPDQPAVPVLRVRGRDVDLSRPLVMAIVNATPDSFSDGSLDPRPRARIDRALAALDAGADLVDVGGQSSITGVAEISVADELDRVLPVVEGIVAARPDALVSVDTYRAEVVRRVLDAGVVVVNDVSCLRDPDVARACAEADAGLVVMHTKAAPKQRYQDPDAYDDVTAEVTATLRERLALARELGVGATSTIVDPGVDYAKTPAQSIALLRDLDPVLALGRPVLWALSRKDFVGALTRRPPSRRDAGSLAAVSHVGWRPGAIFRVHDVVATLDHLAVAGALAGTVPVPRDLAVPDEIRWEDGRAGQTTAST